MALIIRKATPVDRETIARIHETAAVAAYAHIFPSDQPFPRDEAAQRWRTFRGNLFVAELDTGKRIVGFVAFDATELHALYVTPDHWRHGIGLRLLEAAGDVRELWVLKDNRQARRFYESQGWCATGGERYQNGVSELRYQRCSRA